MHTTFFNILCFSCQGKSRDIVYQRTCLFSWLIFVKHGLFGIQLTAYSARSRLIDHGIYYIIRCEIWLLTIFHIPYIHFQRELKKVTLPKWYLSFFVQYTFFVFYAKLWYVTSSISFRVLKNLERLKQIAKNTYYECLIFRVTGVSVKASQTETYYRTSQLRLRNAQGSQVSSFDFSTLYRESKMYLCISRLCHI